MKAKGKVKPAFNLKVFLTKAHGKKATVGYGENALIFSAG